MRPNFSYHFWDNYLHKPYYLCLVRSATNLLLFHGQQWRNERHVQERKCFSFITCAIDHIHHMLVPCLNPFRIRYVFTKWLSDPSLLSTRWRAPLSSSGHAITRIFPNINSHVHHQACTRIRAPNSKIPDYVTSLLHLKADLDVPIHSQYTSNSVFFTHCSLESIYAYTYNRLITPSDPLAHTEHYFKAGKKHHFNHLNKLINKKVRRISSIAFANLKTHGVCFSSLHVNAALFILMRKCALVL